MKNRTKSLLAISMTFCLGNVFSQNPNGSMQWKTNGNNADTNFFIGTINQRDLKFKTNDTEHLRIKKDGNVGIGTMNPQEKLHVRGSVKIDSVLTARSLNILKNSNYQGNAIFQRRLGVAGLTTLDSVTINGPLKLMSLNEFNSVTNDFEILLREPATGEIFKGDEEILKDLVYRPGAFPCKDDAGGNITPSNPIWNNSPGILYTNTLCVPDVKVGIGLASPSAKLHIQTNTGRLTHPILVTKDDASQTKLLQLDNTGLLYAREIKVNLDAWPDYVFEPNYALLPLENLSNYINTNKHLPGVPSACEIEEKGVNVAETSVLLMEKVEELTLYMIQLQEQVKAQEILIKELQSAQK